MVPALTLFLRFPLKTAIGTSLLAMIPAAIVAVIAESQVAPENLHFDLALGLSAGAIAGTFLGRWILAGLGEGALRVVYAVFLVLMGMRLIGVFSLSVSMGGEGWILHAICAGIGIFAGASSTLFGIGGGVVAVPLLLLVAQGLNFHEARATSLVMIPLAAAAGVWHHAKMGSLDRKAAWQLGIPACLTAVAGSVLAQKIPARDLQSVFAILMVLAAWKILREKREDANEDSAARGM